MTYQDKPAGTGGAERTALDRTPAASPPPPPPSPSPPSPPPPSPPPPLAQPPTLLDRVEVVPVRVRWVVAAAAAAVATDLAVRRPPWNNVASAVAIVVVAAGLAFGGRDLGRHQQVALGGAVVFAGFLPIRSDPWLVTFNLMAAWMCLLVTVMPGVSFRWLRSRAVVFRGLEAMAAVFATLGLGAEQLRARWASSTGERRRNYAAAGRGLLAGAPVLVLLAALLASADAVFASFFSIDSIGARTILVHGTVLAVGALAMATALWLTTHPGLEDDGQPIMRIGRIETLSVLAALDGLFLLFASAQLLARSAGGAAALEASGLSYSDYARQGFFQLLWVAGITLTLLVVLQAWSIQWSTGDRWFVGLSLAAVTLTLLIVTVALLRLWLYIDDFGLTPLRFYSSAFSVWIGLVFLILSLRLVGWRPHEHWLLTAIVGSGLVALVALNLVSPERVIAQNLLERADESLPADAAVLSADGRAELANGLDRLPRPLRIQMTGQLCAHWTEEPGDVLGWNRAEAKERAALSELCGS